MVKNIRKSRPGEIPFGRNVRSCDFGNVCFFPDKKKNYRYPQIGLVIIDDNSEILIGDGGVQVKQWDRQTRSDFAIYTQKGLDARNDAKDSASDKKNISSLT